MKHPYQVLTIYKVFPYPQCLARGTPVPHVIGVTRNLEKTRERHRLRWKAGEWTPETPLVKAFGAENLLFTVAGPPVLRKFKKEMLKEYRSRPGCLPPGTTTLPRAVTRGRVVVVDEERRARARLLSKLDYQKNRAKRVEQRRAYLEQNREKVRLYRREYMRRRRARLKGMDQTT